MPGKLGKSGNIQGIWYSFLESGSWQTATHSRVLLYTHMPWPEKVKDPIQVFLPFYFGTIPTTEVKVAWQSLHWCTQHNSLFKWLNKFKTQTNYPTKVKFVYLSTLYGKVHYDYRQPSEPVKESILVFWWTIFGLNKPFISNKDFLKISGMKINMQLGSLNKLLIFLAQFIIRRIMSLGILSQVKNRPCGHIKNILSRWKWIWS